MLPMVTIAEPPSPSMYLFVLHKTLFTAQKSPKPFKFRSAMAKGTDARVWRFDDSSIAAVTVVWRRRRQ
ncbi:hypothetical protein CsSME_00024026 [Camellia sinensis var. sinensis]